MFDKFEGEKIQITNRNTQKRLKTKKYANKFFEIHAYSAACVSLRRAW
jgi:hypothetical protein